jgi:dimethylhistidine N-methyltransferase
MSFAQDVRAGLGATPKTLPPKYLYDALGSALFEAICLLPEYYLARAESEILERRAHSVVDAVGTPLELVELGSGSAVKTRHIIGALLARQPELSYRPIDISATALDASALTLEKAYPGVRVAGINADYFEGLRRISRNGRMRRLALFLGSNIGNFDRQQALDMLRGVRAALGPGGALLMGADLRKNRVLLENAYNDALGVTAAFNLNLLARINRELGGHFDLKSFAHIALYNEAAGRMEMHLRSSTAQSVELSTLDLTVRFDRGETIFTEASYKYDLPGIEALATDAGFKLLASWTDEEQRFSSNLLVSR